MQIPNIKYRQWGKFSLPLASTDAVALAPKEYSFTATTSVEVSEGSRTALTVGSGHDFVVGDIVYLATTEEQVAGLATVLAVTSTTIIVACGQYAASISGTISRPIAAGLAMLKALSTNAGNLDLYFSGMFVESLAPGDFFNIPAGDIRDLSLWSVKPSTASLCTLNVVYEK